MSHAGAHLQDAAGFVDRQARESLALALVAVEERSGTPARVLGTGIEDGRPVFELREAFGLTGGGRRYRVSVDPALGLALVTPLDAAA